MSFWNLNDDKKIDTSGSFETGGDLDPIPAKTEVLAACDEAKWVDYNDERYISLRWTVLKPDQYKNRKVFQKLRVLDAEKADKAKRMLAAIDANAGGKLMAEGGEPTDELLTRHLTNKPMILRLAVWEIDTDNGIKTGNWVSAVSPKGKVSEAKKAAKEEDPPFDDDLDF